MTLNGIIALILLYFTELVLQAYYVPVVEDRLDLYIVCRIPSSTFGQNWPTLQRGLSAIAELLVNINLIGSVTCYNIQTGNGWSLM